MSTGVLNGLPECTAMSPWRPNRVKGWYQLCSGEKWLKRMAGVKLEGSVKLLANGQVVAERDGDILFTNYGISGLAILDISREVSLQLSQHAHCELELDFFPQWSREKLASLLHRYLDRESDKPAVLWMEGFVNHRLAAILLENAKLKDKALKMIDRKAVGRLAYAMKHFRMSIAGSRGYKGAEVSTGGVDTREINPHTMESKIIEGLYFAGEIVDVDGDRGGFNLHFAWVSGMRAAHAMIKDKKG